MNGDLSAPRWGTLANLVTGVRVVAALALVALIVSRSAVAAALVFGLAVATDLVDGRVARRRGEVSPLGGLLDHAADAFFCSVGLGALAWRGDVPPLLPPLVATAFLQYALDSRSLAGRPLRASSLGRWNGILYFALLGTPLVRDALGWSSPSGPWVESSGWVLVATTLASMGERLVMLLRSRRDRHPDQSD